MARMHVLFGFWVTLVFESLALGLAPFEHGGISAIVIALTMLWHCLLADVGGRVAFFAARVHAFEFAHTGVVSDATLASVACSF